MGPFEGFPSSKPILLLKSDLLARGSQEILDTAPSAGLSIQWAHGASRPDHTLSRR